MNVLQLPASDADRLIILAEEWRIDVRADGDFYIIDLCGIGPDAEFNFFHSINFCGISHSFLNTPHAGSLIVDRNKVEAYAKERGITAKVILANPLIQSGVPVETDPVSYYYFDPRELINDESVLKSKNELNFP